MTPIEARNQAIGASKNYTDASLNGLGALKGAPATIKSIVKEGLKTTITFEWTGLDGTVQTGEAFVYDGYSPRAAYIKEFVDEEGKKTYHLIFILNDDLSTEVDAGILPSANVFISEDEGNALKHGEDGGLYVPATGVKISEDEDNALKSGSDGGLYVPAVKEETKDIDFSDF